MHNIPTAEEFIKSTELVVKFDNTQGCILEEELPNLLKKFAKLHVEKIKNLQDCKYYAGETGYILKEEWNEILTNIK